MKKAYNKRTLDGTYGNNSYDDMRSLLNLSRLLKEQEEPETGFETYQEEDVDNTTDEEEQTKEYTVSGGKIVTHGMTAQELELTGDEQGVYQETMDEFVEQVSDMAEFHPLELYKNNVEWSGELLKFDIRFYYSIAEVDGVYIGNANMVKIDTEFAELLEKLKTYFNVFSAKWAKVLASRRTTDTETEGELGTAEEIEAEDE